MFRSRKKTNNIQLQPNPQKLDTLATSITMQCDDWSVLEYVVTRETANSFDYSLFSVSQDGKERINRKNKDPIYLAIVIQEEMYAAGMQWQKMIVTVKKESDQTFGYETKFEY